MGKPFNADKTGVDQTRGLISTLAAYYSLGKALHSIKISRHMGKPFDANKKGPDQMRGLISTLAAHYSLRKALHSGATLFSKDGRILNVLSSPFLCISINESGGQRLRW